MTHPQQQSSGIDTMIELYDSDIKAITEGPVAWHEVRMKARRHLDDHAKGLEEQFNKIGLKVEVQLWADVAPDGQTLNDKFTFQIMILDRIVRESGFDYDKMRHEVQTNLLEIPGEGGTIKFDEKAFLKKHGGGGHHH